MPHRNEGTIDRGLRGVLGALLVLSGMTMPTGGVAVTVVGAVVLLTAAIGWCPLYSLLGLNTCQMGLRRSSSK